MLSFSHPWFLLLLLLVPLLAWWRLHHKRPALRYSDARLIGSLPQGRARLVRRLDAFLHAGALFALVIALAGPRRPLPTPIQTEGIAMLLAVAVSGRMREIDFEWNGVQISRLEAVKRAFGLFVIGGTGPDGQTFPGRPSDLIGLVTFATYPESAAPLTLSHPVLIQLLEVEQ